VSESRLFAPVRDAPLAALAPLVLSAFAFFPITRNFFHDDDFLNLYEIANDHPFRFIFRMHGGHMLASSNALFALFFRLFDAAPAPYFWAALLAHLANVLLLFALVRRLTASRSLACFAAALWGTLPVNEGSLGWYSVFGHVLATTCSLAVLAALAHLDARRGAAAVAGWVAAIAVATTSFGVGLGVAVAMPVVAFLLLPPGRERRRAVLAFSAFAVATPIAYFGLQHLYAAAYGGSAGLTFIMAAQRYWQNSLRLTAELLFYASACLLFGIAHQAPRYPSALATIIVGICALAFAAVFAFASGRARRNILALLFLATAAYAVIGAGRGMFAQRIAGLASAPRFHYLGPALVAAALAVALGEVARRAAFLASAAKAVLPLWLAAVFAAHALRGPIPKQFAYSRYETAQTLAAIRAAIAKARPGEDVYIDNRGFRAIGLLLYEARHRFPGWAGIFAIYFPSNLVDGRRVHFLESDPKAIESAADGRRTAGLLVSYEQVGRTPPPPEPRPSGPWGSGAAAAKAAAP
jgi:hypothetical protein